MSNIKALEKSIHKHTITAMDALTLIKAKFEMELKSKDLTPDKKHIFEADMRRIDNIIEQILCLETMDEFYKLNYGLFPSLFETIKSEGTK